LRDKRLTLKAKGLYAFIASLPPEWDFTVKGLEAVLKEAHGSIQTAIIELEECGYLVRKQRRGEKGHYGSTDYILTEGEEGEEITDNLKSATRKSETKERGINTPNERKKKTSYKKSGQVTAVHFRNERHYTAEELEALMDNIDDIHF
jgi:predicted transcriptional regulator